MGDPIREVTTNDNPCPLIAPWSFDDDASVKVLAKAGDGQALRSVKIKITEVFDAGTLAIGKSGDTDAYLPAVNLVGLAVGTVIENTLLLEEFTDDTEIIATLTGSPTTGNADGEFTFHNQFSNAK